MGHVQATGVSLAYGARDILRSVTVNLRTGDRCALAGANGSGKSTLMKILVGSIVPDTGTVTCSAGARVSYLAQSGISHQGRSLREEVEAAYTDIRRIIDERDRLAELLAGTARADESTMNIVEQHHALEERVQHSGYYEREAEISRVLSGLGFTGADMDRQTDEFSGGWQMRIALAKVLLERPDFLLLDEPTNYLDVEARIWLGRFLAAYPGGVLLVSHDRRFLDETVDTIWELFLAEVKRYRGTYTKYEKQRQQELEQTIAAWEQQQEEIRRVEDFIRRFRATASKAKQVQSRVKQLEKLDRIEIPEHLKRMTFRIPPAPRSGREVITLEHVSRAYDGNRVISDLNLIVERGERVVLAGPNGAGKSTLLRILADQDSEFSGGKRYGAGVALGYYADDDRWLSAASSEASGAVGGPSVIDTVSQATNGQNEQQLRNLLGGFLFHGDDVYKKVAVLSGGERSRVALLQLLLRPLNLLVLDEPTNHLDMTSKSVLLDSLRGYDGTIVFVSHDRSFIESLATRVVELTPAPGDPMEPSVIRDYPGDYSYYAWKLSHREQIESAHHGAESEGETDAREGEDQRKQQELHKQRRNRIQQLEREMDELLERMDALQARHQEIQKELTDPLIYGVGASVRRLKKELDSLDAETEELSARWESVEVEHERLLSD